MKGVLYMKDYELILRDKLCEELRDFSEYKSFQPTDIEAIKNIYSSLKNMKLYDMGEGDGYSEHYPYYDDMGSSYARGRGKYAKRDRMGRYSSDMDDKDYSERYDRRYSMDKAKDHMMSKLGAMMEDANPTEREALKKAMREIENA